MHCYHDDRAITAVQAHRNRLNKGLFAVRLIITTSLFLLLSGCALHPLGLDKETWMALTPFQQREATRKQQEVDRARSAAHQAERAAKQARSNAREAEWNARLRTANYGDRVQCVLFPASVYRHKKWRPTDPLPLDLVNGMMHDFYLLESKKGIEHKVYAGYDGRTVAICPTDEGYIDQGNGYYNCLTFRSHDFLFRRGIGASSVEKKYLQGHLSCVYAGGY